MGLAAPLLPMIRSLVRLVVAVSQTKLLGSRRRHRDGTDTSQLGVAAKSTKFALRRPIK